MLHYIPSALLLNYIATAICLYMGYAEYYLFATSISVHLVECPGDIIYTSEFRKKKVNTEIRI